MNNQKVYITIFYARTLPSVQIKEVVAGLEEEGVPFLLQKSDPSINFIELGWNAAMSSPLQVGIGIDQHHHICVHHQKLNQTHPYLKNTLQNGRKFGQYAARIVKGLPLYY
ncbi:glycerol dehydratase reactivase beta/small subunit family protein [Thalassobacillus devorans]|uniref:glycerol dehydratase reactivase beta/small subunit family protein n=1 Tax=Thalassobacillus devorans TaxID=279813 RepID=UPI0004B6DB93|nr:glycerol dehydratase reactivase beta/small subunit family protein [Thalassobacillus devorans]